VLRVSGGNPVSPDGRFRIGVLSEGGKLAIFDKTGNELLTFDTEESGRGLNIYWSPDSQRVFIAVQWKWSAAMDAAQISSGEWQTVKVPDATPKIEEQAKPVLRNKTGRKWTAQYDYLDSMQWLSDTAFVYNTSVGFGDGNSPKDPDQDAKEFQCTVKMEFVLLPLLSLPFPNLTPQTVVLSPTRAGILKMIHATRLRMRVLTESIRRSEHNFRRSEKNN
jgi:hypothetical protein